MAKIEQWTKGRKPYERHIEETDKAFEAFVIYRDMDPLERSLLKATAEYRKRAGIEGSKIESTHRQLEQWSTDNRWVERVAEWDRSRDNHRRKTRPQSRSTAA